VKNEFSRKKRGSKNSQPNVKGESSLSNSLISKLSQVVEVEEGGEFFLGTGLGSISSYSLLRLVSFHGYLSTGAFIGLQMLALGKRLLGIEENQRIHVLCETQNCLPDPFQVLAGATIGNKGLMVRDTGKMSVTITRHTPPGKRAPGVRIILDPAKTKKFERLHAWYMNTAKVPHREVIKILREAGETVYCYDYIDFPVPGKREKRVVICNACGEPFIQIGGGERYCSDCAGKDI
jgi:formylmethanofuran dehydrogenase subunit E